jgi:hypothetical protein
LSCADIIPDLNEFLEHIQTRYEYGYDPETLNDINTGRINGESVELHVSLL